MLIEPVRPPPPAPDVELLLESSLHAAAAIMNTTAAESITDLRNMRIHPSLGRGIPPDVRLGKPRDRPRAQR